MFEQGKSKPNEPFYNNILKKSLTIGSVKQPDTARLTSSSQKLSAIDEIEPIEIIMPKLKI